jgi:hypothetical protein
LLFVGTGIQLHISFAAGYGVFTLEEFQHGDFVLEYAGKLISVDQADAMVNDTYLYNFFIGKMEFW